MDRVYAVMQSVNQYLQKNPANILVVEADANGFHQITSATNPSLSRLTNDAIVNLALAYPGRVIWHAFETYTGSVDATMCLKTSGQACRFIVDI